VYEAYTYTALGVWIVEDDSAVQSIEIDWYWDGTNTGVWSRKFINPKLTGTSTQSAITRPSSTVTAVLPMRVIRYTGTVFGYPSGDPGDKVGYVNSNYWKGKDVGGWMITRMRTLADYLGASYTVTAEVTRAHIGDWRSAVRAYSSMDGAYAQIDQTKFDQGMAKPYKQGFIAGRDEGYGYEMFGLYPTTDFNAIFGA
jgi:hypothetical protein